MEEGLCLVWHVSQLISHSPQPRFQLLRLAVPQQLGKRERQGNGLREARVSLAQPTEQRRNTFRHVPINYRADQVRSSEVAVTLPVLVSRPLFESLQYAGADAFLYKTSSPKDMLRSEPQLYL